MGRFRLGTKKKFVTVREVSPWNGLPREVLDKALTHLVGGVPAHDKRVGTR